MNYLSSPEGFEWIAVFETCAVGTDAYSIAIAQFWYPLIDMYRILSSVEFGDELRISVLRERAIRFKSFNLKITILL
jgi:hypothetical protein